MLKTTSNLCAATSFVINEPIWIVENFAARCRHLIDDRGGKGKQSVTWRRLWGVGFCHFSRGNATWRNSALHKTHSVEAFEVGRHRHRDTTTNDRANPYFLPSSSTSLLLSPKPDLMTNCTTTRSFAQMTNFCSTNSFEKEMFYFFAYFFTQQSISQHLLLSISLSTISPLKTYPQSLVTIRLRVC